MALLIRAEPADPADPFQARVRDIFHKRIDGRCGYRAAAAGDCGIAVSLEARKGLGPECYRIERGRDEAITIAGDSGPGLLYGAGKLLRLLCGGGPDLPGLPLQAGERAREIRGIYLATHFHNYYHDAPMEQIEEYIEDMALWGVNTLAAWFDMHHYRSMRDPEAIRMVSRIRRIFGTAKSLGLKTSLTMIANEAFADSPAELRADWTAGHDGYTSQLAGHYHVELCPNKPGALDLLLRWREETLREFADTGPDYIVLWPYDQGGCTCGLCKPWGTNGFMKTAGAVTVLAKKYFPQAKVIVSAWMFDRFTSGEWAGLAEMLGKARWVDCLLAEFPEGQGWPASLFQGLPEGLPVIGFPEISMAGAVPWGGFGANPLPLRLQRMWDNAGSVLSGGFPYSEGIFEDMNKAICTQLYYGEAADTLDIAREYIRYEYSPEHAEAILRAIPLLERGTARHRVDECGAVHDYPDRKIPWKGRQRFVIGDTGGIDEAFRLICEADGKLDVRARRSWRWRILFLRCVIDHELAHHGFVPTARCENAFRELTAIYHAEKADYCVAPPTIGSIDVNRGGFSWF